MIVEERSPNEPRCFRYRWVVDYKDGYAATRRGALRAIKRELEWKIRMKEKQR